MMMNKKRAEFLKEDFVQGFPKHLGVKAINVDDGIFESSLKIRTELKQQDGFVHAGIIATLADHTSGYAAYSIVSPDKRILTIEFKINFFKPAKGEYLKCRAKVIHSGKKIIISESNVFSLSKNEEILISKAIVTLIAVMIAK